MFLVLVSRWGWQQSMLIILCLTISVSIVQKLRRHEVVKKSNMYMVLGSVANVALTQIYGFCI